MTPRQSHKSQLLTSAGTKQCNVNPLIWYAESAKIQYAAGLVVRLGKHCSFWDKTEKENVSAQRQNLKEIKPNSMPRHCERLEPGLSHPQYREKLHYQGSKQHWSLNKVNFITADILISCQPEEKVRHVQKKDYRSITELDRGQVHDHSESLFWNVPHTT